MASVDAADSVDLSNALEEHGESLASELRLLSGMPQVRLRAKAVFDRAVPRGSVAQKRGAICKLLCCGGQVDQKCNDLEGERACATIVDAVRLLRLKVEAKHNNSSCLQKVKDIVGAGEGSASSTSTPANAFESLMQSQLAMQRARSALKRAQAHAAECAAANRAANEKHKQAQELLQEAEEEVARLEGNKRQRCASPVEKERPPHFEKYCNYDLPIWLRTTGEIMNRRSLAPAMGVAQPSPPEGEEGALRHWRRGLAGCVRDWACGSLKNVGILIVRLINYFEVKEMVLKELASSELVNAKVDAAIVSNIGRALNVIAKCQTKQQWLDMGVLLRGVAPPPVKQGDSKHGMVARIARRLGSFVGEGAPLPTGYRWKRGHKRDYAFEAAVKARDQFEVEAEQASRPREDLAVGDVVFCRGVLAKLDWFEESSGRCGVRFSLQDMNGGVIEKVVPFKSRFVEGDGDHKGSARLQRPQPSLMPPPRKTRKDSNQSAERAEVREHVHETFSSTCPVSPHSKDVRKRYLGLHVVQELQAMIQTLTLNEIYCVFQKTYPHDRLSFKQFRLLKPWNVIKAYRETCLCRLCEIFRLYVQGLHVVAKLLNKAATEVDHDHDADDEEAEAEAEAARAEASDPALVELAKFCGYESKSQMVLGMVCGGSIENAKLECIKQTCPDCGFKKLWSQGLRQRLVGSDNTLQDGISNIWEHEIRWETLKSGGSTPPVGTGSTEDEKETLRVQKQGTVVDFLDAFEQISYQFPSHRHLVNDTKAKALQRYRNCWPGMLLSDYDWSENGVITIVRQIQSEYWSLTQFSLFISITRYLKAAEWLNRESFLPVLTEVTVEPESAPAGSLEPAKGSFWATVHASPGGEGEEQIISVRKEDGSVVGGIPRHRLRHRAWHTTAFIGITDEKRHDGPTTQHMLNRQFAHWMEHLDVGKFWAWMGHSDNASHFKSGAMMQYWSSKISELDFLKACWVEFGCPGHGKGPWDGMGAVMKQQLKRDLTNNKVLTASGYVRDPKEVAEHLRARFQTEEWIEAHKDKKINEIVVTYAHHDSITERPVVEHEFEPLTGKMSSFSFLMLARDQIARRERSCWCEPCFRQLGRSSLVPSGNTLICEGCMSNIPLPWYEQTCRDLGTGLAGRRREAQSLGAQLAPKLKAGGFFAVQARERWSLNEDVLYRPGHFWLAEASSVQKVRKVTKRETINGQPFHVGDYVIYIGRYFDRDSTDLSSLSFEEWQPELVFSAADVGCKLSISQGVVKVDRRTREEVYWDDQEPPVLTDAIIISVDTQWVKVGQGQNGNKFRNPRIAGGFVVNSTELRAINFTLEALDQPLLRPRTSGRRSAVVSAPTPKRYKMHVAIDAEIRSRCW